MDDFIRNFLIKVGLTRTLDSFNTEWYELQAKGRLGEEYTTKVPDIYLRNEELDEQVIFTLTQTSWANTLEIRWNDRIAFSGRNADNSVNEVVMKSGRSAAVCRKSIPHPCLCLHVAA